MSDLMELGHLARSQDTKNPGKRRERQPRNQANLCKQPPAYCKEQVPERARSHQETGARRGAGRVHLRRYSAPGAGTGAAHTSGASELSFGDARGGLDGEAGRPRVQPVPSGQGSLFSFPRSIASHQGSVSVCGPRGCGQPPGFLRTWCSRKPTFRRNSGPRFDRQGRQPLLVTWPDETWPSRVTCWKPPRQPASGGPPPPQLHRLPAGHHAGPQARIRLISPSPSSGASLEVLVLSQIRSELIPFLQRTPVAK